MKQRTLFGAVFHRRPTAIDSIDVSCAVFGFEVETVRFVHTEVALAVEFLVRYAAERQPDPFRSGARVFDSPQRGILRAQYLRFDSQPVIQPIEHSSGLVAGCAVAIGDVES